MSAKEYCPYLRHFPRGIIVLWPHFRVWIISQVYLMFMYTCQKSAVCLHFPEEDKERSCDVASDVAALEEVLRMILEIINSTLISQNKSNSNFIYTLLYQQHIFEPFHKHPNFQDLLLNIKMVCMVLSIITQPFII